ncbi:hypothetical protein KR044_004560 [Drosophila immigrans]|nr:hypothetical protein KR044_004560 [Drosophila immigrans]
MPRNNTCRPSECAAGDNDNDNCTGDGDQANGQQQQQQQDDDTATTATVKQEFDAAPPVCHRKSERRKIARDIFLVFEEQPSSRRRRGRGGARGKCTRAKQKFGHLSVPNTPMRSSNSNNNSSSASGNNNQKSSVLREIKTEPKCSTAATATGAPESITAAAVTVTKAAIATPAAIDTPATTAASTAAATAAVAMLQLQPEKPPAKLATVKLETKTASNAINTTAAAVTATVAATPATIATVAAVPQLSQSKQLTTQPTPTATSTAATVAATPSVNPIFLWVKQDDTRIVEVRCEDYDKRNRIRLTKTTNGWRSMPRTDASSSRIVKFFQVKREQQQQLQQREVMEQQEEEEEEREEQKQREQQLEEAEEQQQLTQHNWSVVQEYEEPEQQQQQLEVAEQQPDKQPALIESVVVVPAQQQQQLEATPDFDALLDSETNASTKATKTSTSSSNRNTPTTYQSAPSSPAALELQLCPKTGLFLPQGVAATLPDNVEQQPEEEEEQEEEVEQQQQPKNLKDLLDDADELLQCSSDNGSNNGVELLDSLVQRSCEDNLQQESTTTTATATTAGTGLSAFCVPDVAGKDLPSILGMDSSLDDAPKCLSFNEAGEIEGLHGDLFLGIDAFDKQPETATATELEAATEVEAPTETATATETEETEADAVVEKSTPVQLAGGDETPKDLSYKKREEVCPPSESRSQCAVTSSSDILKSKSPELELELQLERAANSIPAEVETTSETIKHLILEQFLKLNGGNSGSQSNAAQQQAEPMDLGKAKGASGDEKLLHTVVIDDEEDADLEPTEPLRKRAKPIKMDKDPDALTQLKMLISNPQWKVPDPILVPKDRLGAVLASPAREIPLLLTTRPELRLPEAFAYPEIIQNPNILVVTMEQLEAILRNESEQSKATTVQPSAVQLQPLPLAQQLPKTSPSPQCNPLKQPPPTTLHKQPSKATTVAAAAAAPPPATPAAASPAADSSMSSPELNATTLALLQQMLWLPYFGQLSQEFFKTLKDPLGLQRKFMSNLMPLYNSQFGLQQLDELYKHCLKQKSAETEAPPAAVSAATAPAAAAAATPTKPPPAFNGFSSPMELAFMQKLLQQQQQQQQQQQSKSLQQQQLHLEHKRPRRETELATNSKSTPPAASSTVAAAAAPTTTTTAAAAAAAAAPAVEHKPRLTCKSLSNLLEPESNVVPLLNVPFDALRRSNKPSAAGPEALLSSGRQLRSSKACVTYNPLEQQAKQSQQQQQLQQRKRGNMLAHELQQQQQHQQQQQQQQHHQQQQQHLAEAAAAAAAAGGAGLDANAALWHPLFGSNPKQGYNSPWQWTTVTATGE